MSTTPMTPAEWLLKLEAEGVNVTGYENWKTHGRDSATGKTFGPANGVVIHHTAGTSSLSLCYNGTSSLPGPLCHTHLSKTAVASMLSVRRANHAGSFAQNAHDAVLAEDSVHPYPDSAEPVDGNDHYYGIEIENKGDGNDRYPWKQYVAAVKWATAICRHHGWTENSVIGHKEGTRRKIDPKGPVQGPDGTSTFDFTMNRFRADVKAALALPAGVWPNQQQEEEEVALDNADLEKIFDYDTIPAVAPPYNNADWDTNKTWSFRYAVHASVLAARQAKGVADETADLVEELRQAVTVLEAKVDALTVGGVDEQALAVKVAEEIYRRLQD